MANDNSAAWEAVRKLSYEINSKIAPVLAPIVDGSIETSAALIMALAREIGAVVYSGGEHAEMLHGFATEQFARTEIIRATLAMDDRATAAGAGNA